MAILPWSLQSHQGSCWRIREVPKPRNPPWDEEEMCTAGLAGKEPTSPECGECALGRQDWRATDPVHLYVRLKEMGHRPQRVKATHLESRWGKAGLREY